MVTIVKEFELLILKKNCGFKRFHNPFVVSAVSKGPGKVSEMRIKKE
jgi:hypothetical protein